MENYTNLKQSKKLAEILPLESADMCYINGDVGKISIGEWENNVHDEDDIPCWSLAALLNVIPSGKALIHDKGNLGYKCICNNMDTYFHDNPLDACYEMIIKLHELNLL